MNRRSIKVMAIISVILQTVAAVAGFGIVVFQKTLVQAFMRIPTDSKIMVFPVTLLFVVVQLIIYIAFYSISQKEGDRVTVIILIVLSIILAVMSVFGNVLGSFIYSRKGAEAVAVYSSVTSIMSYINTLFVIPAEALFYIACGRYISKPE